MSASRQFSGNFRFGNNNNKKPFWFGHVDQVRENGKENPKMYSEFISLL